MPSWLLLILVIAGCIAWTALLAAGHTGRLRTLWEAAWQFALYLAVLAAPALLVWIGMLIFRS